MTDLAATMVADLLARQREQAGQMQAVTGPMCPAVQLRILLIYGRNCGWEFDAAWRWAFERVRMPHDTTTRREWRQVLGSAFDDQRPGPLRQREMWRRAYERQAPTAGERAIGYLWS
jgi:hypothetical protein